MATSKQWALDVNTCDLCVKATKQFCNSCQVSLCETCVKKHRDESTSLYVKSLISQKRNLRWSFLDVMIIRVRDARPTATTAMHQSVLSVFYQVLIRIIRQKNLQKRLKEESKTQYQKQQNLKKNSFRNLKKTIAISKAKTNFDDLGGKCKSLRQSWHQELDDIFDKIDFLSKTFKDQNLNRLHAYKSEIRNSKCYLRY